MKLEPIKWRGMKALRIATRAIELVVTTSWGPRIAHLSRPGGRNLLFRDTDDRRRGDWRLGGGHRVWTWRPGADECEETYAADNEPCTVEPARDRRSVRILGAEHPVFRLRRGLVISEAPRGALDVTAWVQNTSDMLWSGGLWALTCVDPAGATAAFPIGVHPCPSVADSASVSPTAWNSFTIHTPLQWAGHTSPLDDPQLRFHTRADGLPLLLIRPQGIECKHMLSVPRGWLACSAPDAGCTFFKLFPWNPLCADRYPFGCNAAFYIGPGNFMLELETLSPWETLQPGGTLTHTERWVVTDEVDLETGRLPASIGGGSTGRGGRGL